VAERNAGSAPNFVVHLFEAGQDGLETQVFGEREIEVFREPVIREIAALERRAALECQPVAQRGPRQTDQEPSQTIVTFEDGLRDAAPTRTGEAVGKQR
jgi:hypothetical protein